MKQRALMVLCVLLHVVLMPSCSDGASDSDQAMCEALLDQQACEAAAETCQVVMAPSPCAAEGGCPDYFAGCIAHGASCSQLNLQTCSPTEGCIAYYSESPHEFESCRDNVCNLDGDCPAGKFCMALPEQGLDEVQCVGYPRSCMGDEDCHPGFVCLNAAPTQSGTCNAEP